MPEQLHILTPSQRAQLRALWQAGATSYERARAAFAIEGFDEPLIAMLRRFDLVAVRKPPAARNPLFYLTPAGVGEARKPTEASHG